MKSQRSRSFAFSLGAASLLFNQQIKPNGKASKNQKYHQQYTFKERIVEMTTKQKLIAGLIASVVVAAIPTTALHWVGFIGCVLTIGALVLNYRGEIKLPATPHLPTIVIGVLAVSFALAFAAGLIKLWAAVAFWVIGIALFVPFAKRILSKISAFLTSHKMQPGQYTPPVPAAFDASDFVPDVDDSDASFNNTSWDGN
jgi:hypothetical protein